MLFTNEMPGDGGGGGGGGGACHISVLYICIYTHIHTYIPLHEDIHAYIHTYLPTHLHTYIDTHTHTPRALEPGGYILAARLLYDKSFADPTEEACVRAAAWR